MLEPAVRPGAAGPASSTQTGTPAFENSTFDQLLAQVGRQDTNAAQAADMTQQQAGALDALGGLGRIENATLRSMLAKGCGAHTAAGSTE